MSSTPSSDRARAHLYQRLEETMGSDAADSLMGYLPPVGWADVATKGDLEHIDAKLTAKIDQVDAKLTAKIDQVDAKLTAKIDQVDAKLTAKIDQVDAKLTAKMDQLEVNMDLRMETLEQRLTALFERGLRQAMVANVGLVVTVMTIAIVAMQLLGR